MKKTVLMLLVVAGTVFQFCSTTKKAQAPVAKVDYTSDVQPLITMHCSPCHIPPKGNKEPLNTYAAARAHADSMIARISLSPGQKGFMPFKHAKLSDSTINVFVRWKENGLLETK
jgi:hypothetical protein